MRYDIQAMEALYGRSTTSNVGDTVYQWADRVQTLETIYDSGGMDTLDASNQTQEVHINLQPGSFQSIGIWSEDEQVQHYVDKGYGDKQTIEQFIDVLNAGAKDARALYTGEDNVAIAYSTYIENAIGGQRDDVIIGNDLDNVFKGNAGSNVLVGGRGYDTAVYDGKRQDYKIEQNLDTSYSITNLYTQETDTVKEIEKIQFDDEVFFFSSTDRSELKFALDSNESKTHRISDGSRISFASQPTELNKLNLLAKLPDNINLGQFTSQSVGNINVNLINGYRPSGNDDFGYYYYVDISGDGNVDTQGGEHSNMDTVSHTLLDEIFNNGNDTSTSNRSTTINGQYLELPTLAELQHLRSAAGATLPTGWGMYQMHLPIGRQIKHLITSTPYFHFADGITYDRADSEKQFFAVKAYHPNPSNIEIHFTTAEKTFELGRVYGSAEQLNIVIGQNELNTTLWTSSIQTQGSLNIFNNGSALNFIVGIALWTDFLELSATQGIVLTGTHGMDAYR